MAVRATPRATGSEGGTRREASVREAESLGVGPERWPPEWAAARPPRARGSAGRGTGRWPVQLVSLRSCVLLHLDI